MLSEWWFTLIFVLPLLIHCVFYLIRDDWQRHYFLQHRNAVIELRVDAHDQWFLRQGNDEDYQLNITRQLLFGKTLLLLCEPAMSSRLITPSNRFVAFFQQMLAVKIHGIGNHIYQRKRMLVLSEITLEPTQFRRLLRRLHASRVMR